MGSRFQLLKPILAGRQLCGRLAWSIDKLTWLILAGDEHVLTAEGFGVEELDEKIKDIEGF